MTATCFPRHLELASIAIDFWDRNGCNSSSFSSPRYAHSIVVSSTSAGHQQTGRTPRTMSSIVGKTTSTLLRPLLPYLRLVPRPLLTLPPVLALHITSNPASTTPISFLLDPLSHPTHLPLLLTLCLIPVTYAAGLISGNVSWVDRSWPIYTPLCSALVILWGCLNPAAGIHGHNLPRLMCMMFLQACLDNRNVLSGRRVDFE